MSVLKLSWIVFRWTRIRYLLKALIDQAELDGQSSVARDGVAMAVELLRQVRDKVDEGDKIS